MLDFGALKNSKKQGDAGLGIAIGWFARSGHTVCIPLTDSQDYDLVVDIEGRLCRVQVKTTGRFREELGSYAVELRVRGGNRSGTGKSKAFNSASIDFLFVVTESGECYFIPSSEITAKTSLGINKKWSKFMVS